VTPEEAARRNRAQAAFRAYAARMGHATDHWLLMSEAEVEAWCCAARCAGVWVPACVEHVLRWRCGHHRWGRSSIHDRRHFAGASGWVWRVPDAGGTAVTIRHLLVLPALLALVAIASALACARGIG
jgi:hypothetical protein